MKQFHSLRSRMAAIKSSDRSLGCDVMKRIRSIPVFDSNRNRLANSPPW